MGNFFLAGYLAIKEVARNRGRFLMVALVIALITLLVLFIAALGEGLSNANRQYVANLDAQFRNTFTGYGFRTQGYYQDYQKWSQTSLDTTLNSLKAAGFHGQQLQSQQAILAALRAQSTGAGGEVQAMEVGNQIAEQQVEQLMALRQLMLVDLQSKQAYQAEQIQKEQAAAAAGQQVFGKQHMVTDDKKY